MIALLAHLTVRFRRSGQCGVMLSLRLLQGPYCPEVLVAVRVPSMSQIDLFKRLLVLDWNAWCPITLCWLFALRIVTRNNNCLLRSSFKNILRQHHCLKISPCYLIPYTVKLWSHVVSNWNLISCRIELWLRLVWKRDHILYWNVITCCIEMWLHLSHETR